MQPLAAWLVARPQNAVIALAVTLALPFLHLFSGIFMVLLVLRQGWRPAVVEGVIAGAIMSLVWLLAGIPLTFAFAAVASAFIPAVVMALVLQSTRSLALTMQVAALVAAVAVVALHAVIGDMVAYWEPVMTQTLEWAQVNGFDEMALELQENPGFFAHMMTIGLVLAHWTMYALYLLFGYRYATMVPGETGPYGRFCDLNFGRVIALIFAIASVLGFAAGMPWLQSVAIVLFAVFWFQGLAVVHWMVIDGELPLFVAIMVYVLLPFLHLFLMTALAVVGYTDAWFGYRRRVVTSNEE